MPTFKSLTTLGNSIGLVALSGVNKQKSRILIFLFLFSPFIVKWFLDCIHVAVDGFSQQNFPLNYSFKKAIKRKETDASF
jgi:hypothetical protein